MNVSYKILKKSITLMMTIIFDGWMDGWMDNEEQER